MKGRISIIIPVYKVEKYLRKCLDSVAAQTYKDLEVLLVDDGSPDGCGAICDEYAGKDERFIVIHKKNEGVARARNSALDLATGDYISFIDSDDWIEENTYEYFMESLDKYGADCVVGRCRKVFDRDDKLEYEEMKPREVNIVSGTEAMRSVLDNGSAIWNRLFKKQVFETLRFPIGRINDDEVTVLHAYSDCEKAVFLNEATYLYRIRENSITTSSFSFKKVDVFYNSKENLEFVRQVRPELVPNGEAKCVKASLYCYFNIMKMKKSTKEDKQKASGIKKEIKEYIKTLDIKGNKLIPFSHRVALFFLKL